MAEPDRIFKNLRLAGWRQFASADIEFHPRLTILTGANGVGKSTLLNILARHLGVERPYLSIPRRNEQGAITYWVGRLLSPEWWSSALASWKDKPKNQVGELIYSDDTRAQIVVPDNTGVSYQLSISDQKQVNGIAITSHRPLPAYQAIAHIGYPGIEPEQAYSEFIGESNARYMGSASGSLIFQIKKALANWAVMGEGNSVLQSNLKQQEAYRGLTEVLRKILPDTLGFLDISVRPPDVVMITKSGEFLIDAASGGVATLIEIGALIYACSLRQDIVGKSFVVTIDEPENHLHPLLQRTFFSKLVETFPQVQFIAATHSPFIVSGLKDSKVYVLKYDTLEVADKTESTRVVSFPLDYANRASTASEILRDVLGVPSTLPQWVETDLQRIVVKYQTRTIDEATLAELKAELKTVGLEGFFSEAIATIARNLPHK